MSVDRPVSLMEIQQIVSGAGCRWPAPGPQRRARIGPTSPCCGPTVGILGAPIGVGTGWTGCPTIESVAIPPYEPPAECPPDPCEELTIRRAIQEALDGPGSPLVRAEISAQQVPDRECRETPVTPPGGAVVVSGGAAGALAAAAALRMGVGGVPGPAAIGLAAVVNLGSANAPTVVFTFFAPDGRLLVVKNLQITSSDSSIWSSTKFSVEVSGSQELLLSNLTPGNEFPINLFVPPGGSVALKAACLDPTLAAVLGINFTTWTKAVVTIDGSVDVLTLGRDPARRRA
jgi:hypothetical protein